MRRASFSTSTIDSTASTTAAAAATSPTTPSPSPSTSSPSSAAVRNALSDSGRAAVAGAAKRQRAAVTAGLVGLEGPLDCEACSYSTKV